MKASWNARQLGVVDLEPLAERPRDGAVRHAEGVEGVGVLGQDGDAALDPVGGDAREAQQLLGRLAARALESVAMPARCASIQSRYCATSGRSAASAAAPSASARAPPSRARRPARPRSSVFSTSALGIHAVRSRRQAPSTISHSAETPWPVAYSGVSA